MYSKLYCQAVARNFPVKLSPMYSTDPAQFDEIFQVHNLTMSTHKVVIVNDNCEMTEAALAKNMGYVTIPFLA